MMRVSELRKRRAGPMTLGRLLALAMGGLAVAVMAGFWWLSAGLLRDQAEEQALARVQVAGLAARDRIRRDSEDGLDSGAVARRAARPCKRLVARGPARTARPVPAAFLRDERRSTPARCCTTASRSPPPGAACRWSELLAAAEEQGERFLLADPARARRVDRFRDRGARRCPTCEWSSHGCSTIVSRREIRIETGEDVRLLQLTNWIDTVDEPMRELHSAALTDGEFNARRIDRLDVYAASVPVLASTGEGVALIEVRLPAAVVESSVRRFLRRLALIALIVGALAVFAGVVLGRRIAQPLRAITRSAVRLGQGDFSASIPVGGSRETQALARTMENMRRNLIESDDRAAPARSGGAGRARRAWSRACSRSTPRASSATRTRRRPGCSVSSPSEVVGRFCGDVLRPIGPDGKRPCETDCPILRARADGSGRATEVLERADGSRRTVVITSAESVDGRRCR